MGEVLKFPDHVPDANDNEAKRLPGIVHQFPFDDLEQRALREASAVGRDMVASFYKKEKMSQRTQLLAQIEMLQRQVKTPHVKIAMLLNEIDFLEHQIVQSQVSEMIRNMFALEDVESAATCANNYHQWRESRRRVRILEAELHVLEERRRPPVEAISTKQLELQHAQEETMFLEIRLPDDIRSVTI